MAQETYKRNQVEEALWAVFATRYGGAKEVPSAFVTRTKRLLEIDRIEPVSRGSTYAFSEGPTGGKGSDSAFTGLNCTCLAIGLEMLDLGFKQREIVLFLRAHQQTIREEIDYMFMLGEGHPGRRKGHAGTATRRNDPHDARLFMIVRKLELPNTATKAAETRKAVSNVAQKPLFAHGLKELAEKLDRLTKSGEAYRSSIILEIGTLIEALLVHLAQSTAKKRGRS